jgi:pyrimidine-specific ribonucleoside hydrolase
MAPKINCIILKYKLLAPLILLLIISCNSIKTPSIKPVKIIFDSDLGPDYDDVGAITLLHAFADSGKAEILATMASNNYELVAPCLNVINTWYGRAAIPVGAPKTNGVNIGCSQHWTDSLALHYPHDIRYNNQAQDARILYRKILASQPDTSVVIVTVGFLTNLNDLLLSEADTISALNGKALVKKKVKRLVSMAGKFPEGVEFNVKEDSTASKYVFENWPTKIILSGFEIGEKIITGKKLIQSNLKTPAQMAYRIALSCSQSDKYGRMSWDQSAVLAAIQGSDVNFNEVKGKIVVEPSGYNRWINLENGTHSYLVFKSSPDKLAEIIEEYMMN